MNYRTLGNSGLSVSELGIGCSAIGKTLARKRNAGAIATLEAAIDKGINLFDTAPGYCAGESERLLGSVFSGRRDQAIIMSKAGVRSTALGRLAARHKRMLAMLGPMLRRHGVAPRSFRAHKRLDFSRDSLIASVNGSLSRLRTDYLDILLLHHPTDAALEHGDFVETFAALQRAGKIRHWGISANTVEQATACLEIPGVTIVQLDMSILSPDPPGTFLARARERNVGVIARKVLEQGVLTGTAGLTKADWWMRDRERLDRVQAETARLGFLATGNRTMAQAALLFMRELDGVATSLVGCSSLGHLEELAAARSLPPLAGEELSRIRASLRQ